LIKFITDFEKVGMYDRFRSDMNTTLLKIHPALPDSFIETKLYRSLEKLDLADMPHFLGTYCKYVRFGSPFFGWAHLVTTETELWHSNMEWAIVLSCRWKWNEKDGQIPIPVATEDKPIVAACIFHEIIHLFLTIIGYPTHDEEKIEECAQKLAHKHPQIVNLIEKLYPGFSMNHPVMRRSFYHHSLI
jgi:hypothetical protein